MIANHRPSPPEPSQETMEERMMSTGADRLSAETKAAAQAVVARMLLTEPSTTKEIVAAVRKNLDGSAGDPCHNFVDRRLQLLRKDGCASHVRQGRLTYWTYTASGRERLERDAAIGA